MLVLGIDTSSKQGGAALVSAQSDGTDFRVLEVVGLEGGTFSAELVPQIAGMLARQGRRAEQLNGIVAVTGPGSFTGLRVGLAAVKGLAETLKLPIAGLSMLEVVASASSARDTVHAVLDAGRGEVYVGEYKVTGRSVACVREYVQALPQFVEAIRTLGHAARVVTPDAAVADTIRANGTRVMRITRPPADVIARLGFRRILAGSTIAPDALDANYIRRSDAEIFAAPQRPAGEP
jgi:tRNA threonylcarbamoyladenosine biosynthesis protein TsaB